MSENNPAVLEGCGKVDRSLDQLHAQNNRKILEECREVSCSLEELDGQLNQLERVFGQVLTRPDMPSGEINSLSSQIMTGCRGLVSRVKNIKSRPESGSPRNAPHVGKVDRGLKATYQRYQTLEADFRRDSQQTAERQYRIVRPDATDAEVREAVQDPDAPIFQQALMSSDRRGQASSTLRNVKERHEAIQNIERQIKELAQLFEDLDTIVQQQEPLVADIEQKGEEIRGNVTKGNEQIGTAIVSARSRNRKKWWCLLICTLIVIAIAIVIAVVVMMSKKKPTEFEQTAKRPAGMLHDGADSHVLWQVWKGNPDLEFSIADEETYKCGDSDDHSHLASTSANLFHVPMTDSNIPWCMRLPCLVQILPAFN